MFQPGQYLIVVAYQVIDPNEFPKVWGDRWLQRYASCLISEQWGRNLTKFRGAKLSGGMEFNGEKILQDALEEREKLEHEVIFTYSLPNCDLIG
jgi:hypothetical protein